MDEKLLYRRCSALVTKTRYRYHAKQEEAPFQTNCLTAVRYIFFRCTKKNLPYPWIGDMPRELLALCGCSIHRISPDALQAGDLIFLKRNRAAPQQRYIVHVMIAIKSNLIFHSTNARGGGYIEDPARWQSRVIEDPARFLRYIDPRNQSLREYYGSEFIPHPIPRSIKPPIEKEASN